MPAWQHHIPAVVRLSPEWLHDLLAQVGPILGEVVNRGHGGQGVRVEQGTQYVARLRLRSIKVR